MANKLDSSSDNKYRQGWKDDSLNPGGGKKAESERKYGQHQRLTEQPDGPVEQDRLKEMEEGGKGYDWEQGEKQFKQPGEGSEKPDSNAATPEEISSREKSPESPGTPDEGKPSLYKGKHRKETKAQKGLKGFWQKHKTKVIVGGIGTAGVGSLMLLVLFIAGSLMLPHFLTNSIEYRFATAARSYRQANQQVLSRKLGLDRASDTRFGQIRQRYNNIVSRFSDAKKMVLLEKYRPKKIVQNMVATGALDFEESTKPQGIFKRTVTTALIVNGERIPLADQKWYRPFANAQDSFRLAQSIDSALAVSERGSTGLVGTALRTGVGSQILQKAGVRGLYAWANRGRDYKGTTPRQSSLKLLQERYSRIKARPKGSSLISDVNKTAQEASDQQDKVIREGGKEAQKLAKDGIQPASVTKVMEAGLRMDLLRTVVSLASTTYAIAFPACIIVDASMQRAGPIIDSRNDALERAFMFLASGAHQQQSGQTTGEAVRATDEMLNKNGDFARSNLQQTANGGSPDTLKSMIPPQGSGAGDFSILNVILPEGAAQFANAASDKVCPTLTNTWFALGEGIGELVLGFFTGGTYTAASKLGTAGVAKAFSIYLGNFAKSLLTKQFAKRFVRQAGTVAGLALLARMITEQYAGNTTDGTAIGVDAINEADAGGVLLNNELNRQGLGGRPQTSAEAVENNIQDRQDLQYEQGKKSAFERYFDLQDPHSLTARTTMNVASSLNMSSIGSFLNMLGKLFNPANIASFFATAFAPKVQAADLAGKGSYQVVSMGFSRAETKAIETKQTYWDVLDNDFVLMDQNADKFQEIKDKYGRCFTDSMGTLLAEQHIVRNQDGSVVADKGLCSPKNLGMNNPDYGDLVFRWRISMRADNALQSADEVANPGQKVSTGTTAPTAISGDVKGMAALLLKRADANQILLTSDARSDLQSTADGKPISYCGTIPSIHPGILQVLVQISDPASPKYFKMSINNFANGHGECRGSLHEKGRATDIQHIYSSSGQKIDNWGPDAGTGEYRSENPAVATAFVNAIASVMPQGSNINQAQCAAVKAASIPAGIRHNIPDTCHHIHIDMQNLPF